MLRLLKRMNDAQEEIPAGMLVSPLVLGGAGLFNWSVITCNPETAGVLALVVVMSLVALAAAFFLAFYEALPRLQLSLHIHRHRRTPQLKGC